MEERPWHRHYDAGVPREIDFEDIALPRMLERSAERFPDRPALAFLNATWSYGRLQEEVERCAGAFRDLGVGPGTRVAIQLPNLPQFVAAFFGALRLGAQVVPTNPLYTPHELEHQWADSACEVAVVTDFLFDQRIAGARSRLAPREYVVASIPEYLRFPLNLLAPLKLRRQDPPLVAKVPREPHVRPFKAFARAGEPGGAAAPVDPHDVAVLQYTGGTTGPSKGAMLTHRNLSANVQQTSAWFTGLVPGEEVFLAALPLFHVFGMTVAMNLAIHLGAKIVLIPNPRDTKALVEAVAKHRVSIFPGVPAMFNALNEHPGIDGIDVSSVKACFSGSAPIPVDVQTRFETLTGARILEGFGMTETSPVTHCNPLSGTRKLGTIGFPVSDTDARVVDAEDGTRVLPAGEEGELCVRGPQVMAGYWNRPDETANALQDGWMHTGDLARMDEDGYFTIVGRKKDMINAGGYKIFPDEVDALLASHDKILEAATIGVPDERRGETVKTFVVLRPGRTMTAGEVEAFCRENLAAYKVPREIEFLDELPKSTVLKVLRRELRERELARRQEAGQA